MAEPIGAVLLLSHGSPESIEALPSFLTSVRGGRPLPPQAVAAYAARYRKIGGSSPLSATTQRIAAALEDTLPCPLYSATRHAHPGIAETLAKIVSDGVRRITAICLTPFYSRLSVGAYEEALRTGLAGLSASVAVNFVRSWHLEPAYLDGVAATVRQCLAESGGPSRRSKPFVIFTAHSLPAHVREDGDPYTDQLRETAIAVSRRLNLPETRWRLAYQSKPSRAAAPWLGPDVTDVVAQLAVDGEQEHLIVPLGFVVDNLETLYDLDIELKDAADALGIRMARTPALNDNPALVAALAGAVRRAQAHA